MKDVRDNLTNNFEKEVQKRIKEEQKKLESFMRRFEKDQLEQSRDILKNQEFIQKKQEASYYWSQYNREEDSVQKLDLLDKIS
jgi:Skp family chaperone for outer membrane proteins